MKTIKLLACGVLLSVGMIGCGNRNTQNGDAENTAAKEKTEEAIAEAVPKPIELGPNDILEFGEPQPMGLADSCIPFLINLPRSTTDRYSLFMSISTKPHSLQNSMG